MTWRWRLRCCATHRRRPRENSRRRKEAAQREEELSELKNERFQLDRRLAVSRKEREDERRSGEEKLRALKERLRWEVAAQVSSLRKDTEALKVVLKREGDAARAEVEARVRGLARRVGDREEELRHEVELLEQKVTQRGEKGDLERRRLEDERRKAIEEARESRREAEEAERERRRLEERIREG